MCREHISEQLLAKVIQLLRSRNFASGAHKVINEYRYNSQKIQNPKTRSSQQWDPSAQVVRDLRLLVDVNLSLTS